ncbi:hypothetical protein LTSESEN_0614 [Salmonella enterica subsp. enterica serovar Senftenberg str. A4-543]|uniref:Uncharacterized protein n=1 Tax=Salmonella enterica subsp. enterica serovar Senftenberg str. A4-543 TaxID=913082 RepID=G5QVE8_SALSE|nr:hypothetical protein LTSESEN_0614 [Salmonella enterica subsp. enterica serovar Senftenberg str. A4-543]
MSPLVTFNWQYLPGRYKNNENNGKTKKQRYKNNGKTKKQRPQDYLQFQQNTLS